MSRRPSSRPYPRLLTIAIAIVTSLLAAHVALATNFPVCTVDGDQSSPVAVSDGSGGAIIAWCDHRGVDYDIYAQHVLSTGGVDPAWPAGGRALCTAISDQRAPVIVSDGAGGAIVAWIDPRQFYRDMIMAQRVLASGDVDPAWPVDGSALSAFTSSKYSLCMVTDGAHGAIAAWSDYRQGIGADIYAMRVLANGTLPGGSWTPDGRLI